MSIPIIDTLSPLGNFPAVNSKDVDCNGTRLNNVLSASAAEINSKVSKTYVDTTFVTKAQSPTKTSQLTNDSGFITSHQDISGKADKSYVDTKLGTKADTETVNAFSERIDSVETEQNTLSERMDTFASLEEGSTTGDAELADIRVGADSVTYESAGNAVRSQISSVKNDISDIKTSTILSTSFSINGGTKKLSPYKLLKGHKYSVFISATSNGSGTTGVSINDVSIVSHFFADLGTLTSGVRYTFEVSEDSECEFWLYSSFSATFEYIVTDVTIPMLKSEIDANSSRIQAIYTEDNKNAVERIELTLSKSGYKIYHFAHGLKSGEKYAFKTVFSSMPSSNVSWGFCKSSDTSDNIVVWEKSNGNTNNEVIESTVTEGYDDIFIWVSNAEDVGKTLKIYLSELSSNIDKDFATQLLIDKYVSKQCYPVIEPFGATTKRINVTLNGGTSYLFETISATKDKSRVFGISKSDDTTIKQITVTESNGFIARIPTTGTYILWSYHADSFDEQYRISEAENDKYVSEIGSMIYVAASDSSDADKALAKYVCDGINDEIEINAAIKSAPNGSTIFLCRGNFYIDAFNSYNGHAKTAIAVTKSSETYRGITIKGTTHYHNGTNIRVRSTAFDGVSESEQPCVFNILADYNTFWRVNIQDLTIALPDWTRNAIFVNLQRCGCGEIKNLKLTAFGDYGVTHPENYPDNFDHYNKTGIADNLVGLRSFGGWTYGDTARLDNISVWGTKYAFQLGGEHLICNDLRTRWNYCGYTFGQYHSELTFGAFDHPITMINCCDESSIQGPIFDYCGLLDPNLDSSKDTHLQSVTMIDFNTEQFRQGAKETVPGMFCGYILMHLSDGTYGAFVNKPFWANDGSGKNFETINIAHKKGGTTAERLSYSANYMQTYFDTDLNKMVIYNGTKWVDFNGNNV